MASRGQRLRVLPDRVRVEDAMVDAARRGRGFVDGTGWMTFGQLVDGLGGARDVRRRRCSPLMARAALALFSELKAGCIAPPEFHRAVSRFPAGRLERAKYLAELYRECDRRL